MVLRLVSRLREDGSFIKMQLDDNILEHIVDSSLGYWMILGYIYIGYVPG